MQDITLLKITTITDDSTGIYQIGELDFGKTGHCENFLEKPGNRKKFVAWLRMLADAAENGTSPFLPYNNKIQREYLSGVQSEGSKPDTSDDNQPAQAGPVSR